MRINVWHLVTETGSVFATIPAADLPAYLEMTPKSEWRADEMLGAIPIFVSDVTGDVLMPATH